MQHCMNVVMSIIVSLTNALCVDITQTFLGFEAESPKVKVFATGNVLSAEKMSCMLLSSTMTDRKT